MSSDQLYPVLKSMSDTIQLLSSRLRKVEVRANLSSAPGGGGAPDDAHYLVTQANATLTNEHVLIPSSGALIYGNAVPDWTVRSIGNNNELLTITAGLPVWKPFDWDDINQPVGADVVHDHTSNAEGGVLAIVTHNILSATHSDSLADSVARGDILYGNATPKWARLAFPGAPTGKVIQATATDVAWSTNPLTIGASASVAGANTGDVTLAVNHGLGLAGQVLNMGTPSTLTAATTNTVTTTTHTHAVTGFLTTVTAHDILSATHGDTTAAAVVRGDLVVGIGASPKWTRYALSVPAAGILNYFGINNTETEPTWKSASSAPGVAASILQTNTSGYVQVIRLNAGDSISVANATRAINLESTDAVLRILRVTTDTQSAGAALEIMTEGASGAASFLGHWDIASMVGNQLLFRQRAPATAVIPITLTSDGMIGSRHNINSTTFQLPIYDFSMGGTAARVWGVERNSTANTAGSDLSIHAGGATVDDSVAAVASAPTVAGAGYTAEDVLTITTGGTGCTVWVSAVGGAGDVTAVRLRTIGMDYTTGAGKVTSGGTGAGCTVNISTILTITNKAGGNLRLYSGVGVGTLGSNIYFYASPTGTTGDTDNDQTVPIFMAATPTAQTFSVERSSIADTAGQQWNIRAGGSTIGSTDKAGGVLSLRGGISTGTGSSRIAFAVGIPASTGIVATASINTAGAGYTTGDVLTITGGGADSTWTVTAVAGAVTAIAILAAGTGYSLAAAQATTVAPAGGTGCKLNIISLTAIGATTDTTATTVGTFTEDRKFFLGGSTTPIYTFQITQPTYMDVVTSDTERFVSIFGSHIYNTSTVSSYGVYVAPTFSVIKAGTVLLSASMSGIAVVPTIAASNVGTIAHILGINTILASTANAAGSITAFTGYRVSTTGPAFTTTIPTFTAFDMVDPAFSAIAADQITSLFAYHAPALTKGVNIAGLYITSITGGGGGWTAGNNYGVYVGNVSGGTTNSSITTNGGNVIFNEGGDASSDVRMESDTEVDMFWLDANGGADGYIYLGGSTNGIRISKGGELTLIGTATRWEDIPVDPHEKGTGARSPAFEQYADDGGLGDTGTSIGVFLDSFDDAAVASEKEVWFNMQLPHQWASTDIYMHVHWIGAVADTTSAPRWGLEYMWKDIGSTFGATTTIYTDGVNYTKAGTDANVTAGMHYVSRFAVMTPDANNDDISSILVCRLFRNSSSASDTYNAAGAKCGLLYVDAHYELNDMGSQTETVK